MGCVTTRQNPYLHKKQSQPSEHKETALINVEQEQPPSTSEHSFHLQIAGSRSAASQTFPYCEVSSVQKLRSICSAGISLAPLIINQWAEVVDDRRHRNPNSFKYPYNCIGMLSYTYYIDQSPNMVQDIFSSGFLIAPRLVLTTASTMPRKEETVRSAPKFLIREDEKQTLNSIFNNAISIQEILFPEEQEQGEKNPEDLSTNFCLLILERPVKREKYLIPGYFYTVPSKVEIYGYPNDNLNFSQHQENQRQNLYGMEGEILTINDNYIQYDIDTSNGQSGSPILVSPVAGIYFAIGIHSGYIIKRTVFHQSKEVLDKVDLSYHKLNQNCKTNIGCHFGNKMISILNKWTLKLAAGLSWQVCDLSKLSEVNTSNIKITEGAINIIPSQSYTPPAVYCSALKSYYKQEYHKSIIKCELALKGPNYQEDQFQLLQMLGMNYHKLRQTDVAFKIYNKCVKLLAEKGTSQYYCQKVSLCSNLALAQMQAEHLEEAEKHLKNCKRILTKIKPSRFNTFELMINVGILYKLKGNTEEALIWFKGASELQMAISQDSEWLIIVGKIYLYQNIIECCLSLERYEDWGSYSIHCMLLISSLSNFDRSLMECHLLWCRQWLSKWFEYRWWLSVATEYLAVHEWSVLLRLMEVDEGIESVLNECRIFNMLQMRGNIVTIHDLNTK